MAKKTGIILMTYGSPATLDEVPSYLKNVHHGKDPSADTVKEFRRRYELIGGSPLIKITQEQAKALEQILGGSFTVTAGMRFSKPFIKDAVKDIADSDRIVGIIMSPQYSPIIMKGYRDALENALKEISFAGDLNIVEDWHTEPLFIRALAEKVTKTLRQFHEKPMVLFSAHSMPKRVIDKEPDYINHLKETAGAVAKAAGIPEDRWMFCYQSAGHTPEEWLKPDFADIMPELKKKGEKNVLIAPVQFLSDHLETLYDIEVGAREQAEKYEIHFHRTESLNTSPLFIKALAAVVHQYSGAR